MCGMKPLKEYIAEAEQNKIAIGHFNISDLAGLKAIFESAKSLNLPIIIGLSEGERGFVGVRQAAALVKSFREQYGYPIFINADHTHSIEKIKEAVEAGFDAVLFDGGKLPLEENIQKTKEVVAYVKSINPDILVEGEMGYIGSGSVILKEIPEGAALKKEDLTKPEEAKYFAERTGVDLLAPSVGNLHGMFANMPNPDIDTELIKEIRLAAGIPLVLHGGSGITDGDFIKSIDAGVSIIHINTEIRLAWRRGVEAALKESPDEVTPYKILLKAVEEVSRVVAARLKLFNKIEA